MYFIVFTSALREICNCSSNSASCSASLVVPVDSYIVIDIQYGIYGIEIRVYNA